MKKFSSFLKRTILVVLPALFACSLSVGQLHDIKPVAAEEISTSENDVVNDIFTIRKTGEKSFELLFSANPKKYKNFRKHHLTELKNALIDILKDIVHTKITELSEHQIPVDTTPVDGEGGTKPEEHSYSGEQPGSLPQMYYAPDTYISLETYAKMIDSYTSIKEGSSYHNLYEVTSQVVIGYAYYYVHNYIERNGLTDDAETRQKVYSDFCRLIAVRLQNSFEESLATIFNQFYYVGQIITTDLFNISLNDITAMLLLVRNSEETGITDAGVKDLLVTIGGQDAKDQILEVVKKAPKAEIKAFFANCPTNVIQSILREVNFDGIDLNNMLETIGVDTFIEIAGDIGVEKTTAIIQYVNDFDKTSFINEVTRLTSAKEVWHAIKNIHIDEILVVTNKQIRWDGLVELIHKIAPLDVLRNLEDGKWRHNFHVVLDTAVDEVTFDVNFGFKGNCKWLRKAAAIIDDHVYYEEKDGRIILQIDMPGFLANMYRYVLEADFFDDELKHELWDLAFSTVDEAYEHIHAKTIYDLEQNASQIDYKRLAESIISADEIKKFFGISRFVTQERVDKFIDLLFKAINKGSTLDIEKVYELVERFVEIPEDMKDKIDKIYEKAISLLKRIAERDYDAQDLHDLLSGYTSEEFNERVNQKIDYYLENATVQRYYSRAQRLLEKIYARVPERFRNKSLMDYYRGESTWSGSGSAHFNITKLIRKIPKIGPKLADALAGLFDKLPDTLSIDFTFTAHDLYRISYHIGDEVKTGALPANTEATFWANAKQIYEDSEIHDIVGWAELRDTNTYNYLDLMPERDVDAYPIYFTTSAGVEKTYDGLESTIEVTPNIEVNHEYSFVWTKDGAILDGETESSITVKNHSDSGTYVCYVDGVKQSEIVVSIDQISVEAPVQDVDLYWDGSEHAYYTSFGETSEDDLLFYGSGDVSATEPGDYTVELELKDTDNYCWANGDSTYHWTIKKQSITIKKENIMWEYDGPFIYDGTEKSVSLVESELPQGVHAEYTDAVKTNAGEYKAVVHIVLDDPEHYTIHGETYYDLLWTIEKAKIEVPPTVGLVQDTFEYDGQEHAVELDRSNLPAAITGVSLSGDTKATSKGEYTVRVSYDYDHKNYYLEPGYQKEFSWRITGHQVDVSNVTWDYESPFSYDGYSHSVQLVGIPTGVKVEYSGVTSATEPGTYMAHARVYTSPDWVLIYKGEVKESVGFDLEWKIAEGTPVPTQKEFYSVETNEAGTSLVWISLSQGVKGEYTLHANEVDTSKYNFNSIVNTGYVDVVTVYDINLYDANNQVANINVDASGNVIDKNFTFTIRILVPETYSDHELVLVYVNESGEVSRLEGVRDGNYMTYKTNHLSIYGLVETHVAGSDPFPYAIVAGAALLGVQATTCWILIVLAKRKRRAVHD